PPAPTTPRSADDTYAELGRVLAKIHAGFWSNIFAQLGFTKTHRIEKQCLAARREMSLAIAKDMVGIRPGDSTTTAADVSAVVAGLADVPPSVLRQAKARGVRIFAA